MNVDQFPLTSRPNEDYHRATIKDFVFKDNSIEIRGIGEYPVTDEMLQTLCKFVAIPKSLSNALLKTDRALWEQILNRMYALRASDELIVKIRDDQMVGISDYEKVPVSSHRFVSRVLSFYEDKFDVKPVEIHYDVNDQLASVIILGDTIYNSVVAGIDYKLGAVIENDSLYGASVRLVVYEVASDSYSYGTPKVLNLSSARYNRTSEDGYEALSNMLVTLDDIMRSDFFTKDLVEKLDELYHAASVNKVTYEEYARVRTSIVRNMSLSAFDEATVGAISNDFRDIFDFYKNYTSIMESDSIWKSTAYSDETISTVRNFLAEVSKNPSLVYVAKRDIRTIAGDFLFNKHLYRSIAIRK